MNAPARPRFALLTAAWLGLLALTGASVALGEWFAPAPAMVAALALVLWLKGVLVARCFIESASAHPWIAAMLRVFVALWPIALVLTALFGPSLVRWATL
jgi:hypothetical protein